ncbi:MAG: helix-turn-helix transcriptional regulator [Thermoleophilaceae bacterium]
MRSYRPTHSEGRPMLEGAESLRREGGGGSTYPAPVADEEGVRELEGRGPGRGPIASEARVQALPPSAGPGFRMPAPRSLLASAERCGGRAPPFGRSRTGDRRGSSNAVYRLPAICGLSPLGSLDRHRNLRSDRPTLSRRGGPCWRGPNPIGGGSEGPHISDPPLRTRRAFANWRGGARHGTSRQRSQGWRSPHARRPWLSSSPPRSSARRHCQAASSARLSRITWLFGPKPTSIRGMGRDPLGEFGENLRALREAAGLTQEELGAIAGIQMADISRLESGIRDARITTIIRLADALAVEPGRLFEKPAVSE